MTTATIIRINIAGLSVLALFLGLFCTNVNAQTPIELEQTYDFTQEPSSTVDYTLTLQSPGQVSIFIENWISTLDWGVDYDRLYIYNSDNEPVDRNVFSSEEDPFLFHMFQDNQGMTFNVGQAGTYTFSIHSGQYQASNWGTASMQDYEMTVTAIECYDAYEPNDEMATATSIGIGTTINAFQWRQINTAEIWGDEDWYSVTTDSPGALRLELIDWVAIYNWGSDFDRLFVYNAAGESIGFAGGNDFYAWMMGGGTIEDPFVIEMNLTHAGTYYLQFHAGNGTSTTPYQLSTSFTPANDLFEPNDDFENAKLIPEAEVWNQAWEWRTLDNTMNVYGDEDFYYFMAAGAGEFSLTLNGWIPIFNWGADYDRLYIYDAEGNSIGDSPYAWMMGETPITFNVPAEGMYYLQLHCGGTYSIDGYQFMLSGSITGIEDLNKADLQFQPYPNPASALVSLNIDKTNNADVTLNIYNLTGELIRSEILKHNQQELNVSNLNNGVYMLELKSKEGSGKQKLIIQR